jgi:hypothetical protein
VKFIIPAFWILLIGGCFYANYHESQVEKANRIKEKAEVQQILKNPPANGSGGGDNSICGPSNALSCNSTPPDFSVPGVP